MKTINKDENLFATRADKHGNVLDAFQYGGESLMIEYTTAAGDYVVNMFNNKDELMTGLYRLYKLVGWMKVGAYSNEQRISFLRTGTMA